MWNEPDIVLKPGEKPKTVKDIAALNARTARIIRRNQPEARIAGLSLANHNAEYFDECITALGEDAKLFDTFIYHGYEYAPEATSEEVERQKQVLARHGLKAKLWQGESGCPSEKTTKFALPNVDWTEYSQAKWDLRRMLEDLGHDVVSSVFTICDFNHIGREINRKGLIKADANHKVIGVKRAYYSVQNVVSLFDDTVVREQGEPKFVFQDQRLNTYSYLKNGKTPVLVFWLARHATTVPQWPDNSFKLEKGEFTYRGQALVDPVWIDLLTGKVYELPAECQQIANGVVKFCKIPFYDSPCVLTERAAVKLQKSE